MASSNWRPGPEVPRAARFESAFCDDPNCGLHILSFDRHNKPICETVVSADGTRRLVGICQDWLYDKATRRKN